LRWDILAVLPVIGCPTLVLHNRHDPIMPVAASRYLAEHIRGAQLVELPFACHVSWDGSSIEASCDEIEAFVHSETARHQPSPRALATVLFADAVDSTAMAGRIGDQRWRHLVDELEELARSIALRMSGRVVKTTGDGVVAVFDRPSNALSAARQLITGAAALNLSLRVGVHTGEIELRGDDIAGLAVNLAARIEAAAGPGQIAVSRTVTDLTVGSAATFEPLGPHQLKGFDESWELYRLLD
jgi:class 3 adenylate cyclase